ncbi:MAG: transporter [Pseudomonadota bacterium]
MKSLKSFAMGGCALAMGLLSLTPEAQAREVNLPPSVPPGHSLGFPVGAQIPPGVYATLGIDYITGDAVDDDGDEVDQEVSDLVFVASVGWVPGFEILGAQYSAGVTAAYILNREADRGDDFIVPPLAGTSSRREGLTRFTIQPIRLAWNLGEGRFASAGLAIQTPINDFDPAETPQLGGDFWTIIPDVAFTWITPDWETTLHASYFISTENATSDYQSGDEFSVNFTALRNVGNGWAVGPLAYYAVQVTDDENNGTSYPDPATGFTTQLEFDNYSNFGVGIGVRKRMGPLLLNANLTTAVEVENEVEATVLQLRATLPLGPPPPPPPGVALP